MSLGVDGMGRGGVDFVEVEAGVERDIGLA
jgi:hypothetical protein